MNETLTTILTRRSIRNYKPEQIPNDILKQIIEAGLYAPSAMGRQPWHIVAVRGFDKIAEVKDGITPLLHAKNKNFTDIIGILGVAEAK